MNNFLVSGNITIETTVKIDNFPIDYSPIEYNFYGNKTIVSGVGFNIVKAIKTLGGNPLFCSLIGNDIYRDVIKYELEKNGIHNEYVLPVINETPQSVILYNANKRKIYLDLKDIQDKKYPVENINNLINDIDIAIVCNVNFSRELLKIVKNNGKLIATDVHVICDINDEYNKDFMEYSDILFLSNENIIGRENEFINTLSETYTHKIIVIGLGGNGLLLYVRDNNRIQHYPVVKTRKIVNTTGAGDALFSSFIYFYNKTKDPFYAIEKALLFASYKIGEKGAAEGFLTENELLKIKL